MFWYCCLALSSGFWRRVSRGLLLGGAIVFVICVGVSCVDVFERERCGSAEGGEHGHLGKRTRTGLRFIGLVFCTLQVKFCAPRICPGSALGRGRRARALCCCHSSRSSQTAVPGSSKPAQERATPTRAPLVFFLTSPTTAANGSLCLIVTWACCGGKSKQKQMEKRVLV